MRSMKFRVLCLVMVLVLGTATVVSAFEPFTATLTALGAAVATGGTAAVATGGIAAVAVPTGILATTGAAVSSVVFVGEKTSWLDKIWEYLKKGKEVVEVISAGVCVCSFAKDAWDWFWDDDD